MSGLRRFACTLGLLAACGTALAGEMLAWDNYPGGSYQPLWYVSSERNTQRPEPSWTVEDVVLSDVNQAVTRIEWVGARDPGFSYSQVDVILLPSVFDAISGTWTPDSAGAIVLTDLPLSAQQEVPDPNPLPEIEIYTASVDLPSPVAVPGTHFYVGVRLVGDGANNAGYSGIVVAAMDGTLRGQTGGYFIGPSFGISQWTPANDLFGLSDPMEFAYRLYTSPIPEPGAGLLLAALATAALRRRS